MVSSTKLTESGIRYNIYGIFTLMRSGTFMAMIPTNGSTPVSYCTAGANRKKQV